MKTILLPTDFSNYSRNAITYVLQLYKREVCNFLLLHVYKVRDYEESSRLTPKPEVVDLQLKQLVADLKSLTSNRQHKFDFTAANKPLVPAVRESILKYNADLVVIGTHGHTGDTEVVYGSNTVNLMEEIKRCPILAVPGHVKFQTLKEIVLAHGFKAQLNPRDLNFLIQLSKNFKAPIRILHIMEEGGLNVRQEQNRKWLLEHLSEQKAEHSFHILDFLNIPLGIYSFTESRGSDLVAFINKKHSLLENLLFDPLYKNLAHFSKVPVLVLHQPD
jgi:nucleotide-binding universal stress UspA family protein